MANTPGRHYPDFVFSATWYHLHSPPVGCLNYSPITASSSHTPSLHDMTTIPARLAKTVKLATTMEEARIRSIDAYRHWYRSAPEICSLYALNVSPSSIRLKIRQDFERNRSIKDLAVINVLLHKNHIEYQETMNCWKQEVRARTSCVDSSPTSCTGSSNIPTHRNPLRSWTSSSLAATTPSRSRPSKLNAWYTRYATTVYKFTNRQASRLMLELCRLCQSVGPFPHQRRRCARRH